MKKILTSQQTKQLDALTMSAQGVSSYELMERAVRNLYAEMKSYCHDLDKKNFLVVAGTGNNGGDGLGLARMLKNANLNVSVWFCDFSNKITPECQTNINRYGEDEILFLSRHEIGSLSISDECIVIDAIFGTGLSRSVTGKYAEVINIINSSDAEVWSIDIPSGLFGEDNACNNGAIVNADVTFAIGNMPLSSMFAENSRHYGKLRLVDIGHDVESKEAMPTDYAIIEKCDIVKMIKPRQPFDHKGTFGHALMIGGSRGKAGASVMASKACLRSGVGLLSVSSPDDICEIMQISVPEAMYMDSGTGSANNFTAIGIGPGIGMGDSAQSLVSKALVCGKPCVVDADALNIIAEDKHMLDKVGNCILTPHPKEFERLFGKFNSSVERLRFMSDFSEKHNCVIVLKGGVTAISLSDGHLLFYIGMNPGIATGGSGDVLTGIITSMLAQGCSVDNAAIAGVWIHGEAGKLASSDFGMISTVATDIISKIPFVTKELTKDL
ncbi:MAG: NAD(P)H-hydrate dehydratase [Bacteroidales bacterium]|nr:NAD(P)H-hydrate dehydratase [Bacteroidales bacterium]